jgi:hypothetical protein
LQAGALKACGGVRCFYRTPVRFVEFLKTTVLLSAGAATALATVSLVAATADGNATVLWIAAAWWMVASGVGLWLGRHDQASPAIGRLLADAKPTTAMPEHRPGTILVNRLWPLLVLTVVACALALIGPQVPGIGAGFAIIWALSWRRQNGAVEAVEGRDGVQFFIVRTSPFRPIALQRAPGLKKLQQQHSNGAVR